MNFQKLISFLISFFIAMGGFVSKAIADGPTGSVTMQMCTSGICAGNFHGTGPWAQTNNPQVNQGIADSMRYGDPAAIDRILNEMTAGASRGQVTYTSEDRARIYQVFANSIQTGNRLTLSREYYPTPLPADVDPNVAQQQLEPLWAAVRQTPQNPLTVVDRVNDALNTTRDLRTQFSFEGDGTRENAQYLEAELSRLFVDEQGLLKNVPFVETSRPMLLSERDSDQGLQVRQRYNIVLAAESVVGARCGSSGAGSNPAIAAKCAAFGKFTDQIKFALTLADRMAAMRQIDRYNRLSTGLEPANRFMRSFVEGIINAGSDVLHGFEALAQSDLQQVMMTSMDAIRDAIVNYPETMNRIVEFARSHIDIILHGSAEQIGEMAGRVAFEVMGSLLPMGGGAGHLARSAESLTETAVGVATRRSLIGAAVDISVDILKNSGRITVEAGDRMIQVGRNLPELGRSLVNHLSGPSSLVAQPRLGNSLVSNLQDLRQLGMNNPAIASLANAFEGHIFSGVLEPGDILIQVQRAGQSNAGNWFGVILPSSAQHAEELFNITQWGNYADDLGVFRVRERVSVYAGRVAGGEGHQILIPRDIAVDTVVEEIDRVQNLRRGP